MTDPALVADIKKAVDALFDDEVSFLQELVRFPSQRGEEQTAQDFMADAFRRRGYGVDQFAVDVDAIKDHPGFSPVTISYDNVFNVVATHRPKTLTGKSLILNGHMDVVPLGPVDMWADPPYSAKVDGDWLYGRGGGDMKAGIAAYLFAMDALKSLGKQPAAPVYMQSVVEEECTGNGALACLVRGYRADAAVIPEPTQTKLVRANVGVIWFQVAVKGVPVHVAVAGEGANAIEASYDLMKALKGLEARWNERRHGMPYFKDHPHPININVGKIVGGDWASSVPAWCTFDARAAIYPGWEPAEAAKEIEAVLAEASRSNRFLANNPPSVAYNGFFAKGYVLEEGTQAEKTLAEAHLATVDPDFEGVVMPAYLDGRVFMLYGDTPCLVYGPYAENIHGFNERVSLASVKRITASIACFIADWCGLEDA
ncbi:MAG: ArgE/DapE family deacylase [Alphaproteobacteria bacterium]|nr:ArgE/DapE family deacylase [Alphaproteobacteria bacterium]